VAFSGREDRRCALAPTVPKRQTFAPDPQVGQKKKTQKTGGERSMSRLKSGERRYKVRRTDVSPAYKLHSFTRKKLAEKEFSDRGMLARKACVL